MVVTAWDPPHACTVMHTGKIVKGDGSFTITVAGKNMSRCTWDERVIMPFGYAGRVLWPLVRPFAKYGLAYSLKKFAKWVESDVS